MGISTIGSFVVAALALFLSVVSAVRNNTKQYATQITELATEMRTVSTDVKEIKEDFRREMADLKANFHADHDRIIKLEMSLDTAWKRIDEMRGGA